MNNNYKYYVFNTIDNRIFSGWEFKEDALESCNDIKEFNIAINSINKIMNAGYKIYTKSYLENNLKIDTNSLNNWSK